MNNLEIYNALMDLIKSHRSALDKLLNMMTKLVQREFSAELKDVQNDDPIGFYVEPAENNEKEDEKEEYPIYSHDAGRSVTEFAKTLGMSGSKLCTYLSRHNMMETSVTGRRYPTKYSMDCGYFKKVISKIKGRNRVWHVITPAGEAKTLQLMKTDNKEIIRLSHPELLK